MKIGKHPYSWRLQMVMQWSLRISMDMTISLHEVQMDLLQNIWLNRAFSYFSVSGMSKLLYVICLCAVLNAMFLNTVIAQLWCAQFSCSFSPSEQHIFFTPISVQSDPHCKQAREILSSFQPCNETNDCLLARQCRGRLRTRQVQLRLKLLCLNLTGQKGDFRKVASWVKCKWAPRKHCRQFVHAGSRCVCVREIRAGVFDLILGWK